MRQDLPSVMIKDLVIMQKRDLTMSYDYKLLERGMTFHDIYDKKITHFSPTMSFTIKEDYKKSEYYFVHSSSFLYGIFCIF
jgi:hypothetical protein